MHIQSSSQDDGVGKPEYTSPRVHIKIIIIGFQRIARRDKKAFLSDQCKEIEENNKMGRLEITSRKLEIPREYFMQRMGSVKDRHGMDLSEAEVIKKRWQEYTEKLYKKDLHDLDNHDSMIT